MPLFSQIGPISQLNSKCIGYSWGKPPVLPIRVQISSIAVASNVTTVVGVLVEGFQAIEGDQVYVQGTSVDDGDLNNLAGVIDSVTGPDANGNITIVFEGVDAADLSTTASVGVLTTIPGPQFEDSTTGPGQSFAVPQNAYGLSFDFSFLDLDTMTVQLEGAITNDFFSWQPIGDPVTGGSAGIAAGAVAQLPDNINFVRLNVTDAADGGTMYARLLAS